MSGVVGHLRIPGFIPRIRVTAVPVVRRLICMDRCAICRTAYKVHFDWRGGPLGRRLATFDYAAISASADISAMALGEAVKSIFDDAVDGTTTAAEWESEFGAGLSHDEAQRRWRRCLNTRLKLARMGISDCTCCRVVRGLPAQLETSDDGQCPEWKEMDR